METLSTTPHPGPLAPGSQTFDRLTLEKFSLGIGDRFGREGVAQLSALQTAARAGCAIVPVWNKSNREHKLIGTTPAAVRTAAEAAVRTAGWTGAFHVDADHIGLETVGPFLEPCDFFTIDVADFIGKEPGLEDRETVRRSLSRVVGRSLPGLGASITEAKMEAFLSDYAAAVREAGRIHRKIEQARVAGRFIAEVSTDEAQTAQSPEELLLLLAALAGEDVRVQTIAPKFTGRFNKGVDYVGDVGVFAGEFETHVRMLPVAIGEFGLPENLKLSVHSGSDKFSLYRPIREILTRHGAGLHLKTAGTTWLEEVIGLALSGGRGLEVAKQIALEALDHREELSAPYATVLDIRAGELPSPSTISAWDSETFARAVTHQPADPLFNASFRQLLHVSFKLAAAMGPAFLDALDAARGRVETCVTENLLERHIRPLFL